MHFRPVVSHRTVTSHWTLVLKLGLGDIAVEELEITLNPICTAYVLCK